MGLRLVFALILVASLLGGCAMTVTTRPASLQVQAGLRVPDDKDDCKDGGWQHLVTHDDEAFRNQGACVSYVNRH